MKWIAFLSIQKRCNVLFCELRGCWWVDLVTFGQSQSGYFLFQSKLNGNFTLLLTLRETLKGKCVSQNVNPFFVFFSLKQGLCHCFCSISYQTWIFLTWKDIEWYYMSTPKAQFMFFQTSTACPHNRNTNMFTLVSVQVLDFTWRTWKAHSFIWPGQKQGTHVNVAETPQ